MSLRTINFVNTVANVPIDLDSPPTFSDSTAAFSIQRGDNSSNIVAVGTPMVRVSAGSYVYSFSEPQVGITYGYWLKTIRATVATYANYALAASSVGGYYAAQGDVQDIYGISNIASWSQLDENVSNGNGNPIADGTRIQKALLMADDYINTFLLGGQLSVPIVSSPMPLTVVDIAARYAGWWLYTSRGFDETTPMGKVFKGQLGFHKHYVDQMLTRISINGITGAGSQDPAAKVGPLAIADLTDSQGNPYSKIPLTVGPNYWPWGY